VINAKLLNSLYLWFDSSHKPLSTNNKIDYLRCLPFIITHLACFAVFWIGAPLGAVITCVVAYALRVFSLTAFYHRCFSHRAFKTSRTVQFIFAFIATAAAQRGPLWWAAHHRHHHRYSDTERDHHSPHTKSFWWSHCGWFLMAENFNTDETYIKDLLKYPELRWLNRFDSLPPIIYGVALFMFGGWSYLIWGYFISTVLVYHVTFSINSLAHKLGSRKFDTNDHSRNNWWLALLTFGEGWHNNHHHYPSSARQGLGYQVDITYIILRVMKKLGLVWDVREAPAH
jgi:stearoyl-CoA desaturase (delta-9 desaturase)